MNYLYVEVALWEGEGVIFGVKCLQVSIKQLLDDCAVSYDGCLVGCNGKKVALSEMIKDGDRVAIYPALQVDPKQKRRLLVENRKYRKKRIR
ncbi:MAG: RnfH family protein [Pseudomonadota bacterium]|nr:RnfH family protein [Pseudomonadota bacterium]